MTEQWFIKQADQSGSITRLAEAAKSTFWGYIGCEVVKAEENKSTICLEVQPHHLNLFQLVHGGVLATMLDNAMALVVMQAFPAEKTVTAQMNVHYLKSAGLGVLTCEAELIHRSQRTFTLEGRLYGDDGELLVWGSGSYRRLS
ncbi:PaaI family thioesterase [Paenibacillus sp. sptzw28]|uniref:PaaI family thioesterase n=1 Tax=Paenibacillus sp. sptzw28 TaxID=715179 RepID=UPI001C6F1775|nr:PaaI family thioesterase [Paenibacillus sp. sptzw28]QYR21251.1 PaaI family thioesterase [Paenibacillus sp. sptzw28]